jgi:hypothetical protein
MNKYIFKLAQQHENTTLLNHIIKNNYMFFSKHMQRDLDENTSILDLFKLCNYTDKNMICNYYILFTYPIHNTKAKKKYNYNYNYDSNSGSDFDFEYEKEEKKNKMSNIDEQLDFEYKEKNKMNDSEKQKQLMYQAEELLSYLIENKYNPSTYQMFWLLFNNINTNKTEKIIQSFNFNIFNNANELITVARNGPSFLKTYLPNYLPIEMIIFLIGNKIIFPDNLILQIFDNILYKDAELYIKLLYNNGYKITIDHICMFLTKNIYISDLNQYDININEDYNKKKIYDTMINTKLHLYVNDLEPSIKTLRLLCSRKTALTELKNMIKIIKPDVECLKLIILHNPLSTIKYVVEKCKIEPTMECLKDAIHHGVSNKILIYLVDKLVVDETISEMIKNDDDVDDDKTIVIQKPAIKISKKKTAPNFHYGGCD